MLSGHDADLRNMQRDGEERRIRQSATTVQLLESRSQPVRELW